MQSGCSHLIFVTLIALCPMPTLTFRMDNQDALVEFFDVTFLANANKGLVKCCCDTDSSKSIGDKFISTKHRTGRCKVYKDVTKACPNQQNTWAEGRTLRSYEHAGGRCTIAESDVHQVYQDLESPWDYCQAVQSEYFSVAASRLGEHKQISCAPGYSSEHEVTTCNFASPQMGTFNPTPQCTRNEEWCPQQYPTTDYQDEPEYHATPVKPEVETGVTLYYEDEPFLQATSRGQEVNYECAPGFAPQDLTVKCGNDHAFFPVPRCVLQHKPDHCTAILGGFHGASVDAAAWGEWRTVTCRGQGYRPNVPTVQCQQDQMFWPEVRCVLKTEG